MARKTTGEAFAWGQADYSGTNGNGDGGACMYICDMYVVLLNVYISLAAFYLFE